MALAAPEAEADPAAGLTAAADAAEARAAELDATSCSWWWRSKQERDNPETGQVDERVAEGCGAELLPRYLTDFGWSVKVAAQSCQTNTAEAQRIANAGERVAAFVEGEGLRLVAVADRLALRAAEPARPRGSTLPSLGPAQEGRGR